MHWGGMLKANMKCSAQVQYHTLNCGRLWGYPKTEKYTEILNLGHASILANVTFGSTFTVQCIYIICHLVRKRHCGPSQHFISLKYRCIQIVVSQHQPALRPFLEWVNNPVLITPPSNFNLSQGNTELNHHVHWGRSIEVVPLISWMECITKRLIAFFEACLAYINGITNSHYLQVLKQFTPKLPKTSLQPMQDIHKHQAILALHVSPKRMANKRCPVRNTIRIEPILAHFGLLWSPWRSMFFTLASTKSGHSKRIKVLKSQNPTAQQEKCPKRWEVYLQWPSIPWKWNITTLGTTFSKFAQLSVPSFYASLQAPISATAVFPPSPPELVPLASTVAEHKPQRTSRVSSSRSTTAAATTTTTTTTTTATTATMQEHKWQVQLYEGMLKNM